MKTLLSYLAAVAAAFAETRLILTQGWYGGYMEEGGCNVKTVTVGSFWGDGEESYANLEQIGGEVLCLYYGIDNGNPRRLIRHENPSLLPAVDSEDALNLLVKWMSQDLNEQIDEGGCSLVTEAAQNKADEEKRFKRLEGVAREVLKSNPGENLFDVLEARIESEEGNIEGLREDGLCAVNPFASSAVEDYYDLMNGMQGKANDERELFAFCEDYFPLTFLAWQESQAVVAAG
jgi:hypothetical protein